MKTKFEIQHNEKNVDVKDLEKAVKDDLKAKKIKTTDIEDLKIYFVPETSHIYYTICKKDKTEVKDVVKLG